MPVAHKDPISIKPGTMLVEYDNIIKTGDLFILRNILTSYEEQFGKYIDLTGISTMTDIAYLPLLIARREKNIFKWLMKEDFDYEKNYDYFYTKYLDMYENSMLLSFGEFLLKHLKSMQIKKVYFWSRKNDNRIGHDIKTYYGSGDKIGYITGPFDKAITDIDKMDFVLVSDLEMIKPFLMNKDYDSIFFSVGKYGFNYDEEEKLRDIDLEKHMNIGTTKIYQPSYKSFIYG